jgi:hypothetical protein
VLRDVAIRDVRPALHPHRAHVRIVQRRPKPPVGDEDCLDPEPLRRATDDLLHILRRGIGVHPDLHAAPELR